MPNIDKATIAAEITALQEIALDGTVAGDVRGAAHCAIRTLHEPTFMTSDAFDRLSSLQQDASITARAWMEGVQPQKASQILRTI
jgi:uncharacterized protein (UPF0147 family)